MNKRPIIVISAVIIVGLGLSVLITSNLYLLTDREGSGMSLAAPIPMPVENMPIVFELLEKNQKEGSWAAFSFCPPYGPCNEQTSVNLQYSIENGVIGLDWVLLASRNIADKEKMIPFIKEQGHRVLEREGNGVPYLRVEDGDLVALGMRIIKDFYRLRSDDQMDLFISGFEMH
tara:strand:+ start:412 stop:933 length:522 start_codon:yes stop_codon:yes gene_type:complete